MDWLRRLGRTAPVDAPPAEPVNETHEGAAPGIAALLEGVSEDRSHAVLDLGPAAEPSLRMYSRFARRIRFADVAGDANWPGSQESTAALLKSVPPQPDQPYDLIFAWDVLDRIFREDHPQLIRRLAELTAKDARLHVVVRASSEATNRPLRFTLLGMDRIRYEATGPAQLVRSRLLPADVVHVLEPFRVVRAFTLKGGLREYVAIRNERAAAAARRAHGSNR